MTRSNLLACLVSLPLLAACEPPEDTPIGPMPAEGFWGFEVLHPAVEGQCGGIGPIELHGEVLGAALHHTGGAGLLLELEGLELRGSVALDGWLEVSGALDQDRPDRPHDVPDTEDDDEWEDDGWDGDDPHGDQDEGEAGCGDGNDGQEEGAAKCTVDAEPDQAVVLEGFVVDQDTIEAALHVELRHGGGLCTLSADLDGWRVGDLHSEDVAIIVEDEAESLPGEGVSGSSEDAG